MWWIQINALLRVDKTYHLFRKMMRASLVPVLCVGEKKLIRAKDLNLGQTCGQKMEEDWWRRLDFPKKCENWGIIRASNELKTRETMKGIVITLKSVRGVVHGGRVARRVSAHDNVRCVSMGTLCAHARRSQCERSPRSPSPPPSLRMCETSLHYHVDTKQAANVMKKRLKSHCSSPCVHRPSV